MSPHRHDNYGTRWQNASALIHGPLTMEELQDHFGAMGRRFGVLSTNSCCTLGLSAVRVVVASLVSSRSFPAAHSKNRTSRRTDR